MSAENLVVAVVGATGAVGREMISVLLERNFPADQIRLLASERSAGEVIEFKGEGIQVEKLTAESFEGVDIALFSAGGSISKEFGPLAKQQGVVVIDNSSAFRMDDDSPLIVPEVNADVLRQSLGQVNGSGGIIIANPNCSTIQMVVALKPLHDEATLKRVVISTYQSVSGAGKQGMDELWNQTMALFNQQELEMEKFAHQIAFNCLPHIDVFGDNGYTREEMKMVNETRKIMSEPKLKITATAVRVPVFTCHSESINLEFERSLSAERAREVLRNSPGVMVMDEPKDNIYPLPVDLSGTDATYVGRIREDESIENGLNLWVVADNLRKGAALNAVQIAEIVLQERYPN